MTFRYDRTTRGWWSGGCSPLKLGGRIFFPRDGTISKVNLWVRLPRLPPEYWNKKALAKITSQAGTLLDIDSQTEGVVQGAYVRVCIQIDINLPRCWSENVFFLPSFVY